MIATQEEFLDQFRTNLRRLIKEEQADVEDVADESGIPSKVIRNLMREGSAPMPKAYTVYALSVYFGVSADELML